MRGPRVCEERLYEHAMQKILRSCKRPRLCDRVGNKLYSRSSTVVGKWKSGRLSSPTAGRSLFPAARTITTFTSCTSPTAPAWSTVRLSVRDPLSFMSKLYRATDSVRGSGWSSRRRACSSRHQTLFGTLRSDSRRCYRDRGRGEALSR